MSHEGHHHEEKKPLAWFASPLHEHEPHDYKHASQSDTDIEQQSKRVHAANESLLSDSSQPQFEDMDQALHDHPAFHRHAEAQTSELFYDLFFVANLTTFTSLNEINDSHSLTAYIGFFSLLWLTWYQVSLYDVRFSADSVAERIAKAIHFGVMVGFAVIGPQWKPGQEQFDYKIYRAFGFILMASRLTLTAQYGMTLWYTKKYKKTVIPLVLVMTKTTIAAILYGSLTATFPSTKLDADQNPIAQTSNTYIAWYVIGITETILTVAVSCIWRIVSFKGTHMVQRMSLLTLIILGEGIIVICKSISKIVKNEYLWTAAVVGQIICAVLIIYFLYMLYFDRIQEEHFGTIKQQVWSFAHFPLHVSLVLVLQGVSLLIIWRQAVDSMFYLAGELNQATTWIETGTAIDGSVLQQYLEGVPDMYTEGVALASYINNTVTDHVYQYVPKGVDASKELDTVLENWYVIQENTDSWLADKTNETAYYALYTGIDEVFSATFKTLFDTFSVTIPKKKDKSKSDLVGGSSAFIERTDQYFDIFDLILTYTLIAGGLSLILTTVLGFISLPKREHRLSIYLRLGIQMAAGIGLCLVSTVRFNLDFLVNYLKSSWIIPTICLVFFICVVVNHITLPKRKSS